MLLTISYILVAILSCCAMLLELKRDLMMLQQNSYRNERYSRWLKVSSDTTSIVRLSAIAVLFVSMIRFVPTIVSVILLGIEGLVIALKLSNQKYKKPLVFTMRAVRIYSLALLLAAIIAAVIIALCGNGEIDRSVWCAAMAFVTVYAFSHLVILAANFLLEPFQKAINKRYYDDAKRILESMPDLTVIGVTGSYGKTSTKHYLYRILCEQFETVMTPGSFNTTLGVVRTIREKLQPYTQIFIAEMGAKQIGDIKEICDLVHPSIGIVTAVGEQHLESFKTIENVQRTKFELIDSLPSDGFAVINNDFEYIANRKVENVSTLRYGIKGESDLTVEQIVTTSYGTSFKLVYEGETFKFETKLVGECNVSNLVAAIVVALHLGMSPEAISRAVADINQVEHRLNVKRISGGVTLIDDAFNSNPVGSSMALDVLKNIEGKRKIVITPGMIELGAKQYEANKVFGEKIAKSADIALIVGEFNNAAIMEGLSSIPETQVDVKEFATFHEAQIYYQTISRPGDVVLYENDLPDTFK